MSEIKQIGSNTGIFRPYKNYFNGHPNFTFYLPSTPGGAALAFQVTRNGVLVQQGEGRGNISFSDSKYALSSAAPIQQYKVWTYYKSALSTTVMKLLTVQNIRANAL